MPFVETEQLGNYVEPDLATTMYTPEQYKIEQEEEQKKDVGFGKLFGAGLERDHIIASYQAKHLNRPSAPTDEESKAFARGTFNIFNEGVVPEEHKKNPAYMKEYAEYGSNQRMVDWVTENINRQEKNTQMLSDNTVAGMGASFLATMLSPEQWPAFAVPAGLLLTKGSTAARLTLSQAVAYEAGVAGVSALAGEALLHETQPTRTIEESMYAVGGSVLFSSLLVSGIGLAQGRAFKVLKKLDDEMATIDSHPNVSDVGPIEPKSAGAREADILLPKELEAAAIKKIDERIDAGEVKVADRDVALQAERKMLAETLSEVKYPKLMRALGYVHPEVRIATSKMHSARVLGEQMMTSTISRLRHQYGKSLGDALETTMSQFKYEKTQLIADVLQAQYGRYLERIAKAGEKKLTYSEFSELVGKANRADDVSDILEVSGAAKQLRSELSKPIEKRLVEQDLIDSYYSGFEGLKREDFDDLMEAEDLEKLFDGDIPIADMNKALPVEVIDELGRMGKLAKEAEIPKGDKSYFHRQWDFGKIDADPQGFIKDVRQALRGVSVEGMRAKEDAMQVRINKLEDTVEGPAVKARSAAERSADKLEAKKVKAEGGEVKKISPEQRLADLKADLEAKKIEHTRYIAKGLDDDLTRAAVEVKNAIEGGTLTPSWRIQSVTAGPLKGRTFIPPSKTIDNWLINDAESVWGDYVDKIAPDLHMKERFGSADIKGELEQVGRDYDDAILKASTTKEARKLVKEKEQTIKDLEAMRDSIHGRYAMPNDPNGFLSKAAQRLRELNFVTFLGQMTVSAIADVGNIIMRHGLRSFSKSLVDVASMSQGMKLAMKQLRALGVAIDLTSNTRIELLSQLDNKSAWASRKDRLMNKVTNKFSRYTGMQHWNAAWKQVVGFTYSNNIIDDAMKLGKGTLDKKKITAYARGGLSETDMKSIAKEVGAQKTSKMDGVWLPDTTEWADQALVQRFKSALIKEVEATIITPSLGDLPLVSRKELGRLVFQFKSFAMTANNKIILATLDDFSAQKMIGLLSMVMLGGVSQIVRDATKGKTTDLTSEKGINAFMDNAINRSGILGYYGDIDGILEKVTRGKAGIIPKFGDEPLSRYASRNVLGSLLGVSAGRIADIGQVTGAISSGEWRESDARVVRRFTAFNNLFWTHRAFNKIEESIGGKRYGPLGEEK